MKWIFPLTLLLFLAGCSTESSADRAERKTLEALNKDFERDGDPVRATSMSLWKQTENRFVGNVQLSNGETRKMEVVRDDDIVSYNMK